jgi:hypothetical protein
MPVAVSSAGGIALLLAAVIVVAFVFGTLIYSVRRSWPQVRDQRDRMRRGGPSGADFDTYAARYIERLPPPSNDRDARS